jgi:hypothetical protein
VKRAILRIGLVLVLGCASAAGAADPLIGSAEFVPSRDRPFGWRGDGSGRFPGATPPTKWSDKNIRWRAVVGSGYSSPILTDKLALVTAEPNFLIALDRADGKVRWKVEIKPADLADEKARTAAGEYIPPKDGSGLMAATPLTDGKSVYVALANGIVCAIDLDGKRRWTTYIDAEQNTGYGRSSSPLLVGGKLIVHMTNLYAFDPATGKQLWMNAAAPSKYGTPVTLKVGDTGLIVTPNGDAVRLSDGKTVAADLGTGEHTSPVVHSGLVYLGESIVSAVRFDAQLKTKEAWSGMIGTDVIGSPLVHDGIFFTVNGKGQLFAFAAEGKGDQKPIIEGRPLFGKGDADAPLVYASLALAGKHLYLNSLEGEVVVLEATRDAKLVSRQRVGSGTGASPVFAGKEMYLRDGNKLLCIGH